MEILGLLLGTIGLLDGLRLLWRARRALLGTTLTTAWNWACGTLVLWGVAWFGMWTPWVVPGLADQLWYGVALLMLATPIAVLGAKRPGARVWAWFVLIPLLLVLGWPAAYAWENGLNPKPLILMEPAVLAILVVAVMGLGNYLGTRYSLSALLVGPVLTLIISPYTVVAGWFPEPLLCRSLATVLLAVSFRLGARSSELETSPGPFVLLWDDFRNDFGIVWARRIQDRFNAAAKKANWPARIELDGLHWAKRQEGTFEVDPLVLNEVEQTFRWLLRRFVDPEWIDQRLQRRGRVEVPSESLDDGS